MTLGNAVIDLYAGRDRSGNDQNDRHRFSKLLQKAVEKGFLLAFYELVFTVLFESFLRFCARNACFGACEGGEYLFGTFEVMLHARFSFQFF